MAVSEIKLNTDLPARSIPESMMRGAMCRCPACGEGKLFRAYLKVSDSCPACGETLSHHRADDAPPYLVITIVAHIIVALILIIDALFSVPPMFHIWTMLPLTLILSLALLPLVKGAIVGIQWAQYMHGFNPHHRPGDDA